MKYILYFPFLFLLILQSSCMKEIDLEYLRPEPKLVLNGVAVVGEPIKINISRTWFFTDDHPNVTVLDADVRLSVNGIFCEQMHLYEGDTEYNNQNYYRSSFIPSPGDYIEITAVAKGYKEVKAGTSMPDICRIINARMDERRDTVGNLVNTSISYRVTLRDDPMKDDYYLIFFQRGESSFCEKDSAYCYNWSGLSINYASEPVFSAQLSDLDKAMGYTWLSGYNGRPFTDELFKGKEYTLNMKDTYSIGYYPDLGYPGYTYNPETPENPGAEVPDSIPRPPDLVRIFCYTVSKPYYLYLKALTGQNDDSLTNGIIDIGLAEPVRIYSNVEGGTGILGGCYRDSVSLEIKQ